MEKEIERLEKESEKVFNEIQNGAKENVSKDFKSISKKELDDNDKKRIIKLRRPK